MDLKNEIVCCFKFMNLILEPKVLDKCEYLCKKYDVEPEEFCNIWCAFAASAMCTDAPTLQQLEQVERRELQKLNNSCPKTPKSNRVENRKNEEKEIKDGENLLGSDEGPIVTYGRIFNDGKGQLDMHSIMLEGTAELNSGQCVHLNIDKVHDKAIFPGQVVVVKGKMLSGDKLIAESLYTDAIGDLSLEPAVTEDPLRIIAAAGPFTLDENLDYDPMRDLLEYVSTNKPHVLILMGPFIDENHPIISKGDIAVRYDAFFENLIESISAALEDTNIQIVVISSMKDVHHHKVYPTPPYKLRENYPNIKYFPDPCLFKINDLILGATTTDIMYHIAKEEVVTMKKSDTLSRLPAHILQQRCFYPLYPPNSEVNVSYQFLESYGMMERLPHVLLLPSKFKTFAKNIQGCVVLNPERLTKGNIGGAFADLSISPGQTPTAERLNCKILNI
ncbi:DNA polymerase alpha subunit B isoform X2 [Harmonia axyridis]|uniref:DNA polymerase alpha subunit B isoform X2 n=1 Tax=Harmonia axyridis TaxID=115357 RepID=UPI001E278A86|nr:DNA polymerase alpha subunit B isoform X2 [Harmonia axyridis]